MTRILWAVAAVVAAPVFGQPGADPDLVRAGNWLVGSFVASGSAAGGARTGAEALQTRPLQDPVVFGDGLYVYAERRHASGEVGSQWVFRIKKAGGKVRVELLRIDDHVRSLVSSDPQMLGNLAPGDLQKMSGCEAVLAFDGNEFFGTTGRDCRGFAEPKTNRTAIAVRISSSRLLLQTLETSRGANEQPNSQKEPQEFRRVERR